MVNALPRLRFGVDFAVGEFRTFIYSALILKLPRFTFAGCIGLIGSISSTAEVPTFFLGGLRPNILSANRLIGERFLSCCASYSVVDGLSKIVGLVSICFPCTAVKPLNSSALLSSVCMMFVSLGAVGAVCYSYDDAWPQAYLSRFG